MHKIFFLLLIISLSAFDINAQELNCSVSVNSSQIQISDRRIFESLQKSMMEFINGRKWTDRSFKQVEKIECSIIINITGFDNVDKFTGTALVQSRRPIFNSSYQSVMINYLDKNFDFSYTEATPIEFQDGTHTSNLTSLMAFYAYVIIGLDFDSYSERGGTQFLNNATAVVNAAQNASESGWKSFETGQKNRYWLIENLTNTSYEDFRIFIYKYHRLGLDVMYDKVQQGRSEILTDLQLLQNVNKQKSSLFIMNVFMDAKREEMIGIFSEAPANEKSSAATILKQLDPAHSGDYQKIVGGNTGK